MKSQTKLLHLLAIVPILVISLLITALTAQAQTITSYIDNDWPNDRYTVHSDGTVTDTETGLIWKQCSEEQTASNGSCSGTAGTMTWKAALEVAANSTFASKSDWRLPNRNELASIAALDRFGPAINSTVFPNTPSDWFWSSSPYAGRSNDGWIVRFGDGRDADSNRDDGGRVRLVRGGSQ